MGIAWEGNTTFNLSAILHNGFATNEVDLAEEED